MEGLTGRVLLTFIVNIESCDELAVYFLRWVKWRAMFITFLLFGNNVISFESRSVMFVCLSLISVDKIFEQLLSNQITGHYDPTPYHRMTDCRKKYSCEVTLITLVEEWEQAADRKELVSILSTDMSKAFDSLYPALTIKMLEAYGFGNRSLDLMRSFFDRRLNGHTSEWKTLTRGCPQGTAFGPLLWIMFQNDMAYHVNVPTLTMYADDHQLFAAGETHGTVESRLKTPGHLASSWYKNNFLLANLEKFQSLTVNPRKIDA